MSGKVVNSEKMEVSVENVKDGDGAGSKEGQEMPRQESGDSAGLKESPEMLRKSAGKIPATMAYGEVMGLSVHTPYRDLFAVDGGISPVANRNKAAFFNMMAILLGNLGLVLSVMSIGNTDRDKETLAIFMEATVANPRGIYTAPYMKNAAKPVRVSIDGLGELTLVYRDNPITRNAMMRSMSIIAGCNPSFMRADMDKFILKLAGHLGEFDFTRSPVPEGGTKNTYIYDVVSLKHAPDITNYITEFGEFINDPNLAPGSVRQFIVNEKKVNIPTGVRLYITQGKGDAPLSETSIVTAESARNAGEGPFLPNPAFGVGKDEAVANGTGEL